MTHPPSGPGGRLLVEGTVRRGSFSLEVQLDFAPGSVVAVLGPNGAGKTTLLRAIAGLLPLTSGRIEYADDVWDDPSAGVFVDPVHRRTPIVFQDFRLFPHLNARDNVAFGARHGAPHPSGWQDLLRRRSRARRDAALLLDRLGLRQVAGLRPGQLSSGQAQRVAVARAMASRPNVLLLDEPLSALDARTRVEVRSELRRTLDEHRGPAVIVTHDPMEALTLAEELVVIEGGRVVQQGAPATVASRPATEYVARLMGLNLFPGIAREAGWVELPGGAMMLARGMGDLEVKTDTPRPGADTLVAVRPNSISVHTHPPDAGSARNRWSGTVRGVELFADRARLDVAGAPDALVDITAAAFAELHPDVGTRVWLTVKATEVTAYPA
ncbi:MAG: ABC transporter ATP-binding protein [Actinomycetales bacterium]